MRHSQKMLIYKTFQLASVFIIAAAVMIYFVIELYLKETESLKVKRLTTNVNNILVENQLQVDNMAFEVAFKQQFFQDAKKLHRFENSRSFRQNNAKYPILTLTNNDKSIFIRMGTMTLDLEGVEDLKRLSEDSVESSGVGIIGNQLVSFKTVPLFSTGTRLLLAKPIINKKSLNAYAKSDWGFNFYLRDKLLLSSVQDPKKMEEIKESLKGSAERDEFFKMDDSWSKEGNKHHYYRKIYLSNDSAPAIMEFRLKKVKLPLYIKVLIAIPLVFCFSFFLLAIFLFNFHEKNIINPIKELHLHLAKIKSAKLTKLEDFNWPEINSISNHINRLLAHVENEKSINRQRMNHNFSEYRLIKEQIKVDEFQFYALLEASSRWIKECEKELSLSERECLEYKGKNLVTLKSLARKLNLQTLVNQLNEFEANLVTENPINRETNIMESYVGSIELIHKYKLIREDLGYSVEPPKHSKFTDQNKILGHQIISYIREYTQDRSGLVIHCNLDEDTQYPFDNLFELYRIIIDFDLHTDNQNGEVYFDEESQQFKLKMTSSSQNTKTAL